MMKGDKLTDAEKADIAKKMARFTGLSEDYLVKANLRVNLFQFMKELQRSRGLTTGTAGCAVQRTDLRPAWRIRRIRSAGDRDQWRVCRGV